MSVHVVRERLDALHADLAHGPPGERCSAGIGRVFNALLLDVQEQLGEDPVVRTINPIWPLDDESTLPTFASVNVLVGQLRAALGPPARPASTQSRAARG